jgi:hypothetical protein
VVGARRQQQFPMSVQSKPGPLGTSQAGGYGFANDEKYNDYLQEYAREIAQNIFHTNMENRRKNKVKPLTEEQSQQTQHVIGYVIHHLPRFLSKNFPNAYEIQCRKVSGIYQRQVKSMNTTTIQNLGNQMNFHLMEDFYSLPEKRPKGEPPLPQGQIAVPLQIIYANIYLRVLVELMRLFLHYLVSYQTSNFEKLVEAKYVNYLYDIYSFFMALKYGYIIDLFLESFPSIGVELTDFPAWMDMEGSHIPPRWIFPNFIKQVNEEWSRFLFSLSNKPFLSQHQKQMMKTDIFYSNDIFLKNMLWKGLLIRYFEFKLPKMAKKLLNPSFLRHPSTSSSSSSSSSFSSSSPQQKSITPSVWTNQFADMLRQGLARDAATRYRR